MNLLDLVPLNQAQAAQKTITTYEPVNCGPASLNFFLSIYSKASHQCYINHFTGAKALIAALEPITIPADLPTRSNINVPQYLISYEVAELAKLLFNSWQKYEQITLPLPEKLIKLRELETAIFITQISQLHI